MKRGEKGGGGKGEVKHLDSKDSSTWIVPDD